MRTAMAILDSFERGRALFDARRYWDAHEAWEDGWRLAAGGTREVLQGLIQVAAALVKLGEGNAEGAVRLLDKALARLAGAAVDPDAPLDVDVAAVTASARSWRDALAAGHPRPAETFPALPKPAVRG